MHLSFQFHASHFNTVEDLEKMMDIPEYVRIFDGADHVCAGQIVGVAPSLYFGQTGEALWVSPLDGRNSEGQFYKIPLKWIRFYLTDEELAIAKKLAETFFDREFYPLFEDDFLKR